MTNRAFFRLILVFSIAISACTPSSNSPVVTPTVTIPPSQVFTKNILGRVIDINGLPVSGANISTETGITVSDDQGWFEITSVDKAQWVTVTKLGYISRTRAAEPGTPILIRISPDDGKTIVLNFGGDTMFGRRFFDPNEDGDPSDGLLPTHPTVQNYLKLITPIQPLLESGDLTVLNLESALSEEPFFSNRDPRPTAFHPDKEFVYASSPDSILALKQAGVDIVDTGNNHIYDLLDNGLIFTLSTLDQANMAHFGSGLTEKDAWAPEIITIKGQTIAFVGCTTIWTPIPAITAKDISYVASDSQHKGGAARCDTNKLYSAVNNAKKQADLVVVMIHGGFEYEAHPSPNIVNLTKIAKSAGAALVINGHPHVTGGFVWDNKSLIAETMGNFIFDQTIWPTFEAYMLTVYIRDGKVIRAFVEPLMVENYIAHGITNELTDYVARGAAGRTSGPFIVENGAMEVDINHLASQSSHTITMDGGTGTIIPIPQGQWISAFNGTGKIKLGRDLLWVGSFENTVVGNEPGTLPLWEQDESSSVETGSNFAYEGQSGIRLSRGSSNQKDAVTTNLHRVLVKPGTYLTISGMVRGSQDANISLQVSWYPDTLGPSSNKIIETLSTVSPGVWQPIQLDIQVPNGVVALGIFLRLSPPVKGLSTADFDNLRVIEWASSKASMSILYNFAYLTGAGNLTFSQASLPGGEDWKTKSEELPTHN